MTCRSDARPLPRRAAGWGLGAKLAAGLVASLAPASLPASAQEPLFLRIRPSDAAPRPTGSGGSDAEIARAARAAREAVWERSAARARLAIASVCTGCLAPPPAAPVTTPEGAQAARVPAEPARDGVPDPAADPTSTRGDP